MNLNPLLYATVVAIAGFGSAGMAQHTLTPAQKTAIQAKRAAAAALAADAESKPVGALKRTIWDGVFTAEQASAGKALYATNCQACHGPTGRGGPGGTGVTGAAFNKMWEGKTLRDLFNFAYSQMPPGSAGSIGNQQDYLNIATYILTMNGAAPGKTKLIYNPDTLAAVAIVRKP